MNMTLEIVLVAVMMALVLFMAGGSTMMALFVWPWIQRRAMRERFPIVIPGSPGMRMNASPVPGITPGSVGRGWEIFRARCVVMGYDGNALDKEFAREFIDFVRGIDGERYIIDQYGRKIAGDRGADVCRVVVVDGDDWGMTAGFHEWGHGADATKGKVDYGHDNGVMWNDIVDWCRKEFAGA